MKVKFPEHVTSASHEGVTYEPGEDGTVCIEDHHARAIHFFREQGFELFHDEPQAEEDQGENGGQEDSGAESSTAEQAEGSEAAGEPDSGGNGTQDPSEAKAKAKAKKVK
jgi:hypothetical protein